MRSSRPVDELETRQLLLLRFRCVAFAALSADVPLEELREALAVAVHADERRRATDVAAVQPQPPGRPRLRLVQP